MNPSDLKRIQALYEGLSARQEAIRKHLGRDTLTATEKILYSHLIEGQSPPRTRGESMLLLQPDRVALQDATAQMAMLQFMQAQRDMVAVPSTIHCDHLIRAQSGAGPDLERAMEENNEVYAFLKSAAAKFGLGFWKPGSGIIHQVVLEKYAFPGGLMIGTDSHTPNAGGLGMLAIGVGGADAAEVMAGLPWEVKSPRLVGVHLKGRLSGWTAPKDVILWVCGRLTTSGGTNKIVEYFGPGARNISATGRGTITNMGAELGATTSIFQFDERTAAYLRATERAEVADLAERYRDFLTADPDVEAHPDQYFDEILELDLSTLQPYLVGPHSPDRARPVSAMKDEVAREGWPAEYMACLIGSCTNSSYEDLERAATIARQAAAKGIKAKCSLMVTPGSQQVFETIQRDGQMKAFHEVGAVVLANACGPCIGMWNRQDIRPGQTNAILTSYNRNFPKRNDGNAETLAFIASPEVVLATALSGRLDFNPVTESIDGLKLEPPTAPELPPNGFVLSWDGYVEPPADRSSVQVQVKPDSGRLEILQPFAKWDGKDFVDVPVLLKTHGQTTTDHISPAGKVWLPLRGHLSGISHNMMHGAVDADTGKVADPVHMTVCGVERPASPWALKAMEHRERSGGSMIVGDRNYGEGSSREHAAMCPRLLGVKAVITRSFARIHETNLKKQGILPLTFSDPADYDKIHKGDLVSLLSLSELAPGKPVRCVVKGRGGTCELSLNHSMTKEQIEWFRAGSALNAVRERERVS
ncbi:MAG: aconitate hydratase [Candidatus Eremiobacterota bacterium]